MEAEVRQVMATVLRLDATQVTDDFSHAGMAWDSLKHVNLVIALERKFGIVFTPDEITRMFSFRAIRDLVRDKVARRG